MAYVTAVHRKRSELGLDSKLPAIGGSPQLMSPSKAAKENVELYYEGSKFYWRMRVNVDLHFFFHKKYDTLEVIPFNVERQEEMDRLYINYTSLSKKIDLAYKEKYEKTKQDIAKDRFKKMPPETELRNDVMKKTINDFLLVTLGVDILDNKHVINLIPSTVDTEQIEASHTPPIGFPVVVVRRRRKTAPGEFSRAMSDFHSESFSVAEACQKAQELTVLSTKVIGKFQKALESGSFDFGRGMSRDDLGIPITSTKTESIPERRWKWAIRKVIRQNEVKKVTEQLKIRELRMSFPIDPGSTSNSIPRMGSLQSFDSKHKGRSTKLTPIPDGKVLEQTSESNPFEPVNATGIAYSRSTSIPDSKPSARSISYGDARKSRDKRPSRDTSPSVGAQGKPVMIQRRGSKGSNRGSDSENELEESTKRKSRSKKRDWGPRPAEAKSDAEEEKIDEVKAKPKRRARATNVSPGLGGQLPPRTLAPIT